MGSIGYKRSLERLLSCARTAHELEARRVCLEREEAETFRQAQQLSARQKALKAERRRMEKALRESDRKRARLETFLSAEARGQDLELLHLRHVQGRTVAQVQAALAEQGVYYGQRHVERLLSAAERRVFPQWEAWEREEKLRERAHRTNEPG